MIWLARWGATCGGLFAGKKRGHTPLCKHGVAGVSNLVYSLGCWFEIQSSFQNSMNHGGKRAGAGRKLGARALVTRSKAEAVLETVNEEKIWQRLLRSRNHRIVLDSLKYLTDRRDGRAVQAMEVSSPDC